MALRRFAQNNAASLTSSPTSPRSPASPSVLKVQQSPNGVAPHTPPRKPRVSYFDSPSTTPSISSSVPFDWDAARSHKPPPYGSPLQKSKFRKSIGVGGEGTPRKRVVRKKTLAERISSIPSEIAFQVSIFPNQVPLPTPQTSAFLIGGTMHLMHLYVRIRQGSAVSEAELTWEDMYREQRGQSWFDWSVPLTLLLLLSSTLNTMYLFTRVRLYQMHRQPDVVSSPHASFVPADLDFDPANQPSMMSRVARASWRMFVAFWRFLLNLNPSNPSSSADSTRSRRVQQLEVWNPGPLESTLFAVYSPVHALLWMATTSSNWMTTFGAMAGVGIMVYTLTHSYEALIKDKAILAAEVMHEYDEKFVYPRINPIRRDVAVMTHQSECVNVWED